MRTTLILLAALIVWVYFIGNRRPRVGYRQVPSPTDEDRRDGRPVPSTAVLEPPGRGAPAPYRFDDRTGSHYSAEVQSWRR